MSQEFDQYELVSVQGIIISDFIPAWTVTEVWKYPTRDFSNGGTEVFFSHDGVGYRLYFESERSEWEETQPLVDSMLARLRVESSQSPSVAEPAGYSGSASEPCWLVRADDYSGSLFNVTASEGSQMGLTIAQSGCDVTGFLNMSPPLIGTGPITGSLDGNMIRFRLHEETSDAWADIDFLGLVQDDEMRGIYVYSYSFISSTISGVGTWNLAVSSVGGTSSVFDLTDGDCFNVADPIQTGSDYEEVTEVPCTGQWDYRVVDSFSVSGTGTFPGDDYFVNEADRRCGSSYDFSFFPTAKSWDLGHRAVTCLKAR